MVASDFKWHTNTRCWLLINEQQRHKLHGHPSHVQVLPYNSLTCFIWKARPASNFWNGTSSVFVDDYMNVIHFFIRVISRGPTLMFKNFSQSLPMFESWKQFVSSWLHQMLFWFKCFQCCNLTKFEASLNANVNCPLRINVMGYGYKTH
jgi:hypothetical protein